MAEGFSEKPESGVTAAAGESYHLLVESENLDFLNLVLLEDTYELKNAVDLCYIDPPYNTGNTEAQNFTYNDAFGGSENWLAFMRERLTPLKQILKPTGVVVISIDDSEIHRLRVLCDEIFGRNNFIAQLVVDGGNPKNNARYFSVTHEYMLVYANSLSALNKSGIKWRKERDGIELLLAEYEESKKRLGETSYSEITKHLKSWVKTAPLSKRLKVFYSADKRGLYTYADLSTPGEGARYDVLHPATHLPSQVPSRGWGVSEERMNELIMDDLILFGADESAQPMRKLYLQNRKDQVQKAILEYPSRSSTHLLEKILGRRSSFNNPKNLEMMEDIIDLILPSKGLILDYFAGSGTTGHAVLNLNARDKGSRRFVLVTNNENDIFDTVTLPRIQAVMKSMDAGGGLKVFRREISE